jgi:hypothetical protein
MSGSGVRTTGMITIKAHLLMAVPGKIMIIVLKINIVQKYYVAALGTSIRGFAVPLPATSTSRALTAISVFV